MATDSTGISSGVRVALRLVTMSAVPSVVRYTFPYAAPLGMYLARSACISRREMASSLSRLSSRACKRPKRASSRAPSY